MTPPNNKHRYYTDIAIFIAFVVIYLSGLALIVYHGGKEDSSKSYAYAGAGMITSSFIFIAVAKFIHHRYFSPKSTLGDEFVALDEFESSI